MVFHEPIIPVHNSNGHRRTAVIVHNKVNSPTKLPISAERPATTDQPPATDDQPLVTVVIPSYNHAQFIGQAIRSVVDQTYKNLELIVIDDGSTDGSASVVKNILAKVGPFDGKLFAQDNMGAHYTINRGISLARGDYIAILNSDDYYYPQRIERLLAKAMHDGCDFVFSKIDHVSDKGFHLNDTGRIRSSYLSAYSGVGRYPHIGDVLLGYNLAVTTSNFFMKKSLVDKVGLFHDYQLVHDWDFLLRVLLVSEPCFVDEPLLAYRVHDHNTLFARAHLSRRELGRMFRAYAAALAEGQRRNPHAPARFPAHVRAMFRDLPD